MNGPDKGAQGTPGAAWRQRGAVHPRGRAAVLRWACVTAAASLLGGVGLVAAAGAGAAPADALTTGGWSGYLVSGGTYSLVSASFVVPQGFCTQGPGESGQSTYYWVGLEDDPGAIASSSIVQTGFALGCGQGQPAYEAFTASLTGSPTGVSQAVEPGDTVFAEVGCGSGSCVEYLDDATQNWFDSVPVAVNGFSANLAAVAAESFNGGINNSVVPVTQAEVDFAPLGAFSPQADEENPGNYGGTAGLEPSALDPTGENFDFEWDGSPGS
jgi:hypothetical protein